MRPKVPFMIFVCLFIACGFACVFPSFDVSYAEPNSSEAEALNNAYEVEPIPEEETQIPQITVEQLNWFSVVNALFEKFSSARVIDCKTRKQYFVQRVGGYNHADVETLSTADTEIFKSIYGGVWSWERRPVWVEIDGVFIAGSINGMPHSYEYNTTNGENGHTCIHFLNSRTHGTNKVDEAHQNAVSYAFKHGDEINEFIWQTQK